MDKVRLQLSDKPAAEIEKRRREEQLKGLDSIGIIQHWYKAGENYVLDVREQKIYERLLQAQSLVLEGNSNNQVITELINLFSISRSQAVRDIENCHIIHGPDPRKVSKETKRYYLVEGLKEAYSMAKAAKDYTAITKITELIAKLEHLDKVEAELDASKIEPHLYIINIDEPLQNFINTIVSIPNPDLAAIYSFIKKTANNSYAPYDDLTT